MNRLLTFLEQSIVKFFKFLLVHFYSMIDELWKAKSDIPPRYLAADFLSVLLNVGMFVFLNILAFVIFTVLPQGKDVLLIVAEDLAHSKKVGNLLWLLIGILYWSVVSEYGCRYAIYVSDNSAFSLSDNRVIWRKAVQKFVAKVALIIPYLIVLVSLLLNYLADTSMDKDDRNWGFGIPAVCVYIIFTLVARYYFDETYQKKIEEKNPGISGFLKLPAIEVDWCNKLFGIYNRYTFQIPQPDVFINKTRSEYVDFEQLALEEEQKAGKFDPSNPPFPQDARKIDIASLVPLQFLLLKFTKNINEAAFFPHYKWVFGIPLSFYKVLHKQLLTIVIFTLAIFLLIVFLPIDWYENIGSPGLVTIAFGCWCGLYVGILYVDFALLRAKKVSLRFVLVCVFLFSSFSNNDHPVRTNTVSAECNCRPELKEHFRQWLNTYAKDSLENLYLLKKEDSSEMPFFPIIFVTAEGGALRTGAFAALTLSFLQDSIMKYYGIDIKKSVYAMSGVSGGSLGLNFVNATTFLNDSSDLLTDTQASLAKAFFTHDFLSPVIAKMFYAELLQLFIPWHIEKFDRAIALEKAWELGYEKVIKRHARNIFSADFSSLYSQKKTNYPAIFTNTTEVESGMQGWISNVRVSDSSMNFGHRRDLMAYKIRGGINYSTSTNFSTRFPLFSPAGTLIQDDGKKFHYIDGGYYENTGTLTLLEVLKALEPAFDSVLTFPLRDTADLTGKRERAIDSLHAALIPEDLQLARLKFKIKPFVLILKYNQTDDNPLRNINAFNELAEPLMGALNTRGGRSETALEDLKKYVLGKNGKYFVLGLKKTGSEVPMNWVLSKKSLDLIEEDIKSKWDKRNVNDLKEFFAIDQRFQKLGKRTKEKDTIVLDSVKHSYTLYKNKTVYNATQTTIPSSQ